MSASIRTAGSTFAASLGLHGLILLLAAGVGAVMPVREREKPDNPEPPPPEDLAEQPDLADSVEVTFVPATPAALPKPKPETKIPDAAPPPPDQPLISIIAGPNQPDAAPLRADTPFVSSQNMRAGATAAPISGADPLLPNQQGVNGRSLSFNQQNFNQGGDGSSGPPTPDPKPAGEQPSPPPTPDPVDPAKPETPPPAKTIAADRPPEPSDSPRTEDPLAPAPAGKPPELAMRERLPDPVPRPEQPKPKPKPPQPADPVAPKGGGSPGGKPTVSSVKTKVEGGLAIRGDRNSVDARDTPEGRYNSTIHDRIGLLWNSKLATVHGIAGVGTVEVEFEIDPKGRITNVRLVDPGKANPVLEDVCLSAVIHAKLPPPPEPMQREMRDPLTGGRLRRKFTFTRL